MVTHDGTEQQLRWYQVGDGLTPGAVEVIDAGASWASIAGSSGGEVTLALTDADGTTLRAFDGDANTPPRSDRRLPGAAYAVQQRGDGSLLWVDGNELWFEPAGGMPRSLGVGYAAAWFVG